jgi:hypothetical protein
MTLINIRFPEHNPFYRIKFLPIFGWLLLLAIGLSIQLEVISSSSGVKLDTKDPLVSKILGIYLSIWLLALVWRQCRLAGIEIKYLVGKVPDRYQWLPLVGLAIASLVFGVGVFRIFYYPLSFIVPSFVKILLTEKRNTSILITASKTFFPALYYLIVAIYDYAISPIFSAWIIAIILHQLVAKLGKISAIRSFFMLSIIYPVSVSSTFIPAILYIKTRSLLVLIIFMALQKLIGGIWNLSSTTFLGNQAGNTLDVFRSQIQLGVLFFALSAPWVIGFIYKNWSVLKGPLPYFANAAEAEKIKADSET